MNYLNFKKRPRKGYGFIYKYTSPSGKSYIGQTTRSLYERAGSKGQYYSHCTAFFSAIKKYGLENFKVEILEEVLEKNLYDREEYYIKLFNTLLPNGYNWGLGKSGFRESKASVIIDVYDLELNFITTFKSMQEAAKEYQIPWQSISQCVRGEIGYYKDKIYTYHKVVPKKPTIIKTGGRRTGQYNDQGELIQEFHSANEAARSLGKKSSAGRNIRSVCEGTRQHAFGYVWKYLD